MRQKDILLQIQSSINNLKEIIQTSQPYELLAEELININKLFNQLQGNSVSEDILDQIFKQFCIGK